MAEIFAVPGMTATPMDVRDVIAVCQYRSLGGQPLFSIDLIVRKTYDGMAPRDYWEKMPEIQRAEKERLDAQGVRSGNRSVIEDVQVGDAGRFLTEPGVGGPCGNLQVLAGERIFVVAETGGSPKTVCVTKERAGVLAERLIAQLPK